MEFLGTILDKPKGKKKGHFKWDYVKLIYENENAYNEASGKLVKVLNSDGKILLKDTENNNYMVDIVHYNFLNDDLTIKVLPYDIKQIQTKDKD